MKKVVSILLVIVSICLIFMMSGCSGSTSKDAPDTPPNNGAISGEQNKEKIKLNFIAALNPATEDINNNEFLAKVAEDVGVEITYPELFIRFS